MLPVYSKRFTYVQQSVPVSFECIAAPAAGLVWIVREVLLVPSASGSVESYLGVKSSGGTFIPLAAVVGSFSAFQDASFFDGRFVVTPEDCLCLNHVSGAVNGYMGGYELTGSGTP